MMKYSESEQAVETLAALAQVNRLAVFRELVKAGNAGLAAGVIAKRVGVPASSLSFHLTNLKHAGLVAERREGRSVIYRVRFGTMQNLISYLLENCCAEDRSIESTHKTIATGEPT
ncbi:metalloregulator ArsR/SmtB family transcription factor [Pontixanthobacter sp. CEM42]|uniref:ArsR/SmtB family transcription factor n=1 Tax=Pontixanthobacter sp. CEM42 TaxID=2792077 RepID=UPI001FD854CF|nr:metalloregulator ArsR/SmtB family transcription factor [Pontixanthobacter sp. CEM42]